MITVGVGLLGTLAVAVAPPLAPPLFRIAGVAIRIADQMVSWLAALPAASVHVVTPSLLELALLYGGLAACLLRGRLRLWLLSGCVLGLVTDARAWALARQAPDTLRITFISVGQGDAALVELPGGRVLVVDGGGLGGRFDVGARVVAPQLWRRKIARADWLALSHADFDHFGGLAFLVEAFAPQALWWNGVPGHGERFAELRRRDCARRALARAGGTDLERERRHPPRLRAMGRARRRRQRSLAGPATALRWARRLVHRRPRARR